jgi:predicted secreted protein
MTRPRSRFHHRASLLLLLGGALVALPAGPSLAQAPVPAGTPAGTDAAIAAPLTQTLLRLSETGEVTRAPDEIRVEMRAEARGADAAAVQAQVNRAMTAAMEKARAVPGVLPTTGGYWTNRDSQTRQWNASQRLSLRGKEAAPMLELAGSLQAQGLAMDGLNWSLSRETAQAARQEAGQLAIAALRARAVAVAAQLDMEVAGIRNLALDAPEAPMPRMAMAMRGASANAPPPPVSAPEDVTVSSTATAEVVLRARR